MDNRPKVLVLLATYNGSPWISEQILSILGQADVAVRLVISDDGSSDDTLRKVQSFSSDDRVAVTSNSSPSGSAAQNFLWLIRNTSAEGYSHISFADQDDIWCEHKLIRACSALGVRGCGGYSCATKAFWADGRERILRQGDRLTPSDFLFEGAGQGCTYVLTSDFYERLRQFLRGNAKLTRRVHYHDWLIYAVSRAWGETWAFDGEPLVRYRQHHHNDTGAKKSLRGVIKRFSLIRCGWYASQIQQIAEICATAAPTALALKQWYELLLRPRGVRRSSKIVRFCIKGGRRRGSDKAVLVAAALAGWI